MISKKKLIASLTTASLLIAVGVGTTLAYFTDKDSVTNTFNMGKVSGQITESSEKEDYEPTEVGVPAEGIDLAFTEILPNDILEKKPVITLNEDSSDAFVRVSITFDGDAYVEGENGFLSTDMSSTDWYYSDGYYYYQNKLLVGDEAVLFNEVTIADLKNDAAGTGHTMNIVVELIQADNFDNNLEYTDTNMIKGWAGIGSDYVEEYTE